MSDTTGWRNGGRACDYTKNINGKQYEIHRGPDKQWYLWRYNTNLGIYTYLAYRPTLRECQQLAHATARLWAGES